MYIIRLRSSHTRGKKKKSDSKAPPNGCHFSFTFNQPHPPPFSLAAGKEVGATVATISAHRQNLLRQTPPPLHNNEKKKKHVVGVRCFTSTRNRHSSSLPLCALHAAPAREAHPCAPPVRSPRWPSRDPSCPGPSASPPLQPAWQRCE